jgi:rhamnose transport system permease protein
MTAADAIARSSPPAPRFADRAVSLLRRPETITVVLLIVAFVAGSMMSRNFLDLRFLLDATSLSMEVGLMALAMTLVIIAGQIDLSVASALALVGVTTALLNRRGLPMPAIIPIALLLGVCLGLFNGLLISKLRLPSLTVTLGTLALYRGIAQILAGDRSIGGFPEWFVGINYRRIGGLVPMPLVIFLVLAVVFALVLHRTVFGRCVYAIGTNESAARFSGLRVDRVKLSVFAISGLMSGAAALMMCSRLTVARYDLANGEELMVITAVVLGGTDIFGGRGSTFGTAAALMLLIILRKAMGMKNLPIENQMAITGTLLIVAVVLGNMMKRVGSKTRD